MAIKKAFEIVVHDGTAQELMNVHDYQIELWQTAFGKDSLDGLFDLTPAAEAIPVIQSAIDRFNTDSDSLRSLVAKDKDWLGLRGNRRLLEKMRDTLASYHETAFISGLHDVDELPS